MFIMIYNYLAMPKAKKNESPKENKNEIVIQETEEDVVLGKGFSGDPEEFKNVIKKEAEQGYLAARFLIPLVVFLLVATSSTFATWYYAKPERNIKDVKTLEEKIETPPVVEDQKPSEQKEEPKPEENKPAPTQGGEISYTVKEGDTLSGIANQFDMTSTELATFNGISDAHSLKIGQVLKVPSK